MNEDPILDQFLKQQLVAGRDLAAASDLLSLDPLVDGDQPPTRYLASFQSIGVLRDTDGHVGPQESEFVLGITFSEDHLRRVDPLRLVTWLGPPNIVQPNIRPPFVCVGHVFPGVELVDLLYGVFEMISYCNWAAGDALDSEAAEWARHHQHLFPVERRPLRRRRTNREPDKRDDQ